MAGPDVSIVPRKSRRHPLLPAAGRVYAECFDLAAGEPTADHVAFVDGVKKQLADLGVRFIPAER